MPPEIEAVTAGRARRGSISPFAEVVIAMVQGLSALWHAILHPPNTRAALPAPRNDRRAASHRLLKRSLRPRLHRDARRPQPREVCRGSSSARRDAQYALAGGLEFRLALERRRPGQRVVVPFGAVDFDDETEGGPPQVGVDRGLGSLYGALTSGCSQTGADDQVVVGVLGRAAGGGGAEGEDRFAREVGELGGAELRLSAGRA